MFDSAANVHDIDVNNGGWRPQNPRGAELLRDCVAWFRDQAMTLAHDNAARRRKSGLSTSAAERSASFFGKIPARNSCHWPATNPVTGTRTWPIGRRGDQRCGAQT